MSIYKNGKLIAGGRQCMPLLSFMWADHQLNDISWLRADTFSWQSGAVYTAVYQHLADDITGKTLQSETIGSTTIQFYLADDGHKICPASEESNVSAIYSATGVAWYYVLDTVNTRFKLPRTKWGINGLRDSVGNMIDQEILLPNITGNTGGCVGNATPNGVFSQGAQAGTAGGGSGRFYVNNFDASRSSSVYSGNGTDTLIQPRATQTYLYFYVGQFTQTATENTAGLNAEMFNDLNAHKVIEFQEPTADNGYTWYRKYADGWVEQGGKTNGTTSGTQTITLPVEMADTNYFVQTTSWTSSFYGTGWALSTTQVNVETRGHDYTTQTCRCYWQVSGMAAN